MALSRRYYRGSRLDRALDIADLRAMARRRLPGFVSEYIEGGAEDEITLGRNRDAWSKISLVHRSLVDVTTRDLSKEILGERSALPCAIAPTGFNGLYWKRADIALARAAKEHGIPFTVSTVSSDSLEEIAEQAGGRLWFQLYVIRDQKAVDQLIQRADDVGCEAIMMTLDAPMLGNRTWDVRNFAAPLRLTLRAKLDVLAHPRWLTTVFMPSGLPSFGNLSEFLPPDQRSALDGARYMGRNMNTALTWADVERLRERWPRKLILKGLLSSEDVARAASLGADAVVLSNHGGRQLDGDVGGIDVLSSAITAAGGRLEIFVDGGIRRGTDMVKALAMGADGVLLGRATLYGLAAGGQPGASRALDILKEELDRALALLGCPVLADLERSYLWSSTNATLAKS